MDFVLPSIDADVDHMEALSIAVLDCAISLSISLDMSAIDSTKR
jgi:hypothetical protein